MGFRRFGLQIANLLPSFMPYFEGSLATLNEFSFSSKPPSRFRGCKMQQYHDRHSHAYGAPQLARRQSQHRSNGGQSPAAWAAPEAPPENGSMPRNSPLF